MKKQFPTPAPTSLYVELGAGLLTAEATDTAETTVEVSGPRAEEFKVGRTGDKISVVAPHGRFFGRDAHTVRVIVPTGSELITKVGSADTVTHGALGLVALKTGSGDIELDQASGPVVIESGSGDIKGAELAGEVRIKSGSGDIDLGVLHGKTGISTGSGDVVLGTVRARTIIKTGSGDLKVGRAEAEVNLTTASGDLTIAAAPRGKVTARNVSGDVRVGIPVGTPVWTDINTVSGSLKNRLTSVGKPAEGQDYVELRATTVSGDVLLEHV
ncbi:DUF4097 and DUF4098 domain-containing protein YvlB [Marmoricola sp. OAE513]|uniref:DUF4097 family beta strand repeat-containing protein n=1 Tax=Marmoricola sp. OAE513 TaxID=2817894 RepID=UPI001AE6158D